MSLAPKANPPIRTLLGPGPSPVSSRVLEALSLPVVGHLDPKFLEIMDQSIAMLVRDSGALLVVDAVTSLGGAPVRVDELGIGACYSGTQKCLGCPPGLSPVTFNDRAIEVIRNRKTKVQSWYLDLSMIEKYW